MKIQRKEAACLGGEIADARRHAQFTAHLNLDASPVPHNDTSRAIDMPRSRWIDVRAVNHLASEVMKVLEVS
jgi:hypothetical protein